MRSVRRIRSIVKRKTAADCCGLLNFQESKRLLVHPADGSLAATLADDQRVGAVCETLEVDGVAACAVDIGHLLHACAKCIVDVNLERTERVRRWWPFLRDRRIDHYKGLDHRFLD